jgi:hypothetical protein
MRYPLHLSKRPQDAAEIWVVGQSIIRWPRLERLVVGCVQLLLVLHPDAILWNSANRVFRCRGKEEEAVTTPPSTEMTNSNNTTSTDTTGIGFGDRIKTMQQEEQGGSKVQALSSSFTSVLQRIHIGTRVGRTR